MSATLIVVLSETRHEIVEVPLTEDYKVSQALILDGLNHTFASGVQIRRSHRQFDWSYITSLQRLAEFSGELFVAIMNELMVAVRQLGEKSIGLIGHPGQIGMCS